MPHRPKPLCFCPPGPPPGITAGGRGQWQAGGEVPATTSVPGPQQPQPSGAKSPRGGAPAPAPSGDLDFHKNLRSGAALCWVPAISAVHGVPHCCNLGPVNAQIYVIWPNAICYGAQAAVKDLYVTMCLTSSVLTAAQPHQCMLWRSFSHMMASKRMRASNFCLHLAAGPPDFDPNLPGNRASLTGSAKTSPRNQVRPLRLRSPHSIANHDLQSSDCRHHCCSSNVAILVA